MPNIGMGVTMYRVYLGYDNLVWLVVKQFVFQAFNMFPPMQFSSDISLLLQVPPTSITVEDSAQTSGLSQMVSLT